MAKQASIRYPKKRSSAQRAQSQSLRKGNKENVPPIQPPNPAAPSKQSSPRRPKDYKQAYQNLQRKSHHLVSHRARLQAALDSYKTREEADKSAAESARLREAESRRREAALQGAIAKALSKGTRDAAKSKEVTAVLRKKNKALQQKIRRAAGILSRSIARAKTQRTFGRVTQKGIYTIQARKLARIMVDAGCARGKVGTLMERVGLIFGVHINRSMSRRTVGRAIAEGGVAAKMQVTYELGLNQGISISADSTSNRGINIESAHMAVRVPEYTSGNLTIDANSTPKIRFLGVDKTIDHTSAESVKAWRTRIEESMNLFNGSPLAQRLKSQYTFRHFLKVLKAMNGDHASTEKGTAKGLSDLKHDEALKTLGEEALAGKEFLELVLYLSAWNAKKLVRVGGVAAWDALSDKERAEHDKALMDEIVTSLGKEAYDTLFPVDRRQIDLFIWGGCCMHKDLNSFKGGNTEMMLEWEKLGVPGPKLLANKQNAATLRNVLDPSFSADAELTEDELRAFQASTCGGVKTCALAGAIFNNKDDKKGQADKHVDFMTRKLDKQHPRFPDTSNTRFGSHGNAAAELITYITEYVEMMDIIQWSKTNPSLTNIEKNLRDALNDQATLTELCAMVLYQQIISHPYLRQVRGPGTEKINLLDLGPLHKAICDHIQAILDNPDLIFGDELACESATLDGKPWQDSLAIDAAIDLMPSLPHLKAVTLAFFRGSLTTWIRFSSEFAPGGLIDQCSATEKQLAWMPSTNDANEGALGAYRVAVRGKPSLTLHQYNSLAMYRRNDTQDFMDAVLTAEDHAYIMREARKIDSNGLERLRRQEIVDFRIQIAEMTKAKAIAAAQKALEIRRQLRKILITPTTTNLSDLTVPKIHLQLNALRLRGVPNILPNSRYARKPAKLEALEAALGLYLPDPSKFLLPPDPEADGESEVLAMETAIVDDWTAEVDIEMEE